MRFGPLSFLLAVSLALAACEQQPLSLRIAAPLSPVDREIAEDLIEMLDENDAVRLELTSSGMSESDALDALSSGAADLAFVSNAIDYREGIASVIPLYPTVFHVAYRQGLDATSGTTLLKGARVFADVEGSASRMMLERIAKRLDLEKGDFEHVDDIKSYTDVIILFTPISPERVAQHTDFRLLSFGKPEDIGRGSIVDATTLMNPNLRPFIIPERTYGEVTPGPVVTLAVDQLLVAREELDESIVYDLVLALLRSRPALSARHPGLFEHLADDFDMTRSTFVVHPGTQAYLQREAPTVYERYSGVAEVVVTLMIGFASATVAGIRILQRRRKNRIDRFYSRAIEIRDSVAADTSDDERNAAIAEIRDLQNVAFDQLVDEKLAADESFRIFITLSNDILRQLGAPSDARVSDT